MASLGGELPSKEYLRWDGVLFDPKQYRLKHGSSKWAPDKIKKQNPAIHVDSTPLSTSIAPPLSTSVAPQATSAIHGGDIETGKTAIHVGSITSLTTGVVPGGLSPILGFRLKNIGGQFWPNGRRADRLTLEVGTCCWHVKPTGKRDMTETTTPTSANDTATKLPAKSYEPTSRDRKAMQAYFDEQRENPPPPRLKVVKEVVKEDEGTIGLFPDHPDLSVGLVLLIDAMGLKDQYLGRELLSQMSRCGQGKRGRPERDDCLRERVRTERLLGGDARDTNGSSACADHAARRPTREYDNEQGTRTRRTRAEQTRQNIRVTD